MGIIAKQSIRGTIVTYIGVAVGFVTTFFVLTRFLTAEEIGLSRVLIDAATLFVGLAQLGTNSSIIRFYPYFRDKESGDHGFFFWTMVVPLMGFVLIAGLYCVCHAPLAEWFGDKSPLFVDYYYMVVPLSLFMLYQTIFETNANVLMHIVLPRAVRELGVRVGLLALYLLYAYKVISLDGFVIGLSLNYGLAALINLLYLFSLGRISLRPDWAYIRAHISLVRQWGKYTGFLIVSAVVSVLAPTLSSFFITAKMGLDQTGIFAIATYMAAMVSIPYRSITAIAAPELATHIKDNNTDEVRSLTHRVSENLILIGGFILLIIWINIDLIYHILPNGQDYAVARYVVLILGLSQLILAVCSIYLNCLSYSRYYAWSLLFSCMLTLSAIVCNNYLIPVWGIEGAAMSNLLSYGLYFVCILLTLRVLYGVGITTRRLLYSAGLLAGLFGLNYVLLNYLPIQGIWLSSIVRTLLIGATGAAIIWRANLAPDIIKMIQQPLSRR